MASKKSNNEGTTQILIAAPVITTTIVPIIGTSILVSNKFGGEARSMMRETMARGTVDKQGGKKRPPKDFEQGYRDSLHQASDDCGGWYGMPCTAFRAALVRAASLCGLEMTKAKMCVFVEADGTDSDGKGLVRIENEDGTPAVPEKFEDYVRNATGVADIRSRGRFASGWRAVLRLKHDKEFLSNNSVANLVMRAGLQVGVGAGRPFSTASVGQGWGTFEIDEEAFTKMAAEEAFTKMAAE